MLKPAKPPAHRVVRSVLRHRVALADPRATPAGVRLSVQLAADVPGGMRSGKRSVSGDSLRDRNSRAYGAAMYPPPAGTELTVDQARELDDTFLSSDPFQYFRCRIASLMAWQETAPVGDRPLSEAARGSVRSEFNAYLQRWAVDGRYKELDVHAQVAADALAVRHHAAEALLRLAWARLALEPITGPRCLWAEIATGPRPIEDVIARLNDSANAPNPGERMLRVLIPSGALEAARSNVEIIDAANVYVDWLAYAGADRLARRRSTLRPPTTRSSMDWLFELRSDMRVTFAAQRPNDDGSMPLSAFTADGAIDIFDQRSLNHSLKDQGLLATVEGWS